MRSEKKLKRHGKKFEKIEVAPSFFIICMFWPNLFSDLIILLLAVSQPLLRYDGVYYLCWKFWSRINCFYLRYRFQALHRRVFKKKKKACSFFCVCKCNIIFCSLMRRLKKKTTEKNCKNDGGVILEISSCNFESNHLLLGKILFFYCKLAPWYQSSFCSRHHKIIRKNCKKMHLKHIFVSKLSSSRSLDC